MLVTVLMIINTKHGDISQPGVRREPRPGGRRPHPAAASRPGGVGAGGTLQGKHTTTNWLLLKALMIHLQKLNYAFFPINDSPVLFATLNDYWCGHAVYLASND